MSFKISIPENAQRLIRLLGEQGHTAYVVGGCVRDSLMGRVPHDWDICTSATPQQMLEIFKGIRVIETGLKHGTVTAVIDGEQYECTVYRIDGEYTDNRRPDKVTFTDDITEDLKRRDFTVNAMAYNCTDGLADPFDGIGDIERRIIKCVGSPAERFNEDALRIMRAVRFSARLGFDIDQETALAMNSLSKNLSKISKERIRSELWGIMNSPSCEKIAELICGFLPVFTEIIPEIGDMAGFEQNNPHHDFDVLYHTLNALKGCESADPVTRLAVLLHDIGKPRCFQDDDDGTRHFRGHGKISTEMADEIMQRLRFDNETRHKVCQLVCYHDSVIEDAPKYVRKWLNKIGAEQFFRLLDVKTADTKGQKADFDRERTEKISRIRALAEEILEEKQCFDLKALEISGKELIDIGYAPGKKLGDTLKLLLDEVMNGTIPNEREILLEKAVSIYNNDNM